MREFDAYFPWIFGLNEMLFHTYSTEALKSYLFYVRRIAGTSDIMIRVSYVFNGVETLSEEMQCPRSVESFFISIGSPAQPFFCTILPRTWTFKVNKPAPIGTTILKTVTLSEKNFRHALVIQAVRNTENGPATYYLNTYDETGVIVDTVALEELSTPYFLEKPSNFLSIQISASTIVDLEIYDDSVPGLRKGSLFLERRIPTPIVPDFSMVLAQLVIKNVAVTFNLLLIDSALVLTVSDGQIFQFAVESTTISLLVMDEPVLLNIII